MNETHENMLLTFLRDKRIFVIESARVDIERPFEIKPQDFLRFAEEDLESAFPHKSVNALANIKRAVDCQFECIFQTIGLKHNKQILGFPEKLSLIQRMGLIAPRILHKISKMRNLMEHEFDNPDITKVEDAFDVVELFIAYSTVMMTNFATSLTVALIDADGEPGSDTVTLLLDKDNQLLTVSSSFIDDDYSFTPNDDNFYVFLERLIGIRWSLFHPDYKG